MRCSVVFLLAGILAGCSKQSDHTAEERKPLSTPDAPVRPEESIRPPAGPVDTTVLRSITISAAGDTASVRFALRGPGWTGPISWETVALSGSDTSYSASGSTESFDDYFELESPHCERPDECRHRFLFSFVTAPAVDTAAAGSAWREEINKRWATVAAAYYEARGASPAEAAAEATALFDTYQGREAVMVSFPDDPVTGAPLHVYDERRRVLVPVYDG